MTTVSYRARGRHRARYRIDVYRRILDVRNWVHGARRDVNPLTLLPLTLLPITSLALTMLIVYRY